MRGEALPAPCPYMPRAVPACGHAKETPNTDLRDCPWEGLARWSAIPARKPPSIRQPDERSLWPTPHRRSASGLQRGCGNRQPAVELLDRLVWSNEWSNDRRLRLEPGTLTT
jgi:hypothetical protein